VVFRVKAGGFTTNTGTGTQTIACVGFTPTAVLYFADKVTTETAATDAFSTYGMTDGTRSKSIGTSIEDGDVCNRTERIQRESSILVFQNCCSCVVDFRTTFTSFNSDGFVICNVTNTDSAAYLIKYLAFGGTTNARVDQALVSGSPVVCQGFQPNVIYGMSSGQSAGACLNSQHAIHTHGWAVRSGCATQQWHIDDFRGEDDAAQVGGQIRDDGFIGQRYNITRTWQMSLTTFDAGGFTWAGCNPDVFYYLIMELPTGICAFVGDFQKTSSTCMCVSQALPDSTFTPQAYMLSTNSKTTKTCIPIANSLLSVGAYSQRGTPGQFNVSSTREACGSQADMVTDDCNVLYNLGLAVAKNAIGVAQTITDSTPCILWTTNDAQASWIGYVAFEDAAGLDLVKIQPEAVNINEALVKTQQKFRIIPENVNITECVVSLVPKFQITGDVRDLALATVGTVRVVLLKHDGAAEACRIYSIVDHTNADACGLYNFMCISGTQSRFMVIAYNDEATDRRGVTNDNLTPVT